MSDLIPFAASDLAPSALDQYAGADDLTQGVGPQLAVLSIKGGKFRIRMQGKEHMLFDTDAQGNKTAKTYLDVIMLRVTAALTKTYYESAFVDGQITSPTCYSFDGLRPAADAQRPQNDLCATCEWNQFKHLTASGKKGKKCSDARRVALVAASDPTAEQVGGPVLLRIPTMSLKNLADFGNELKKKLGAVKYNSIVVRLSFAAESTYPQLTFSAVRPLTTEEKTIVLHHYTNGAVDRVLQDVGEFATPPASVPAPEPKPEPELEPEPAPAPEPAAAAPPKPKTTKAKKTNGSRGRKPTIAAAPAAESEPPPPPTVVESVELTDGLEGLPADDHDLFA